jgi:hypothetical protein
LAAIAARDAGPEPERGSSASITGRLSDANREFCSALDTGQPLEAALVAFAPAARVAPISR